METLKYASGNAVTLVPNGIQDLDESMTIRIQLGDKGIDDIEADLQAEDLGKISLYGEDEKLVKNYTGYKYIKSVTKLYNVPVDIVKVEDPEEAEETAELEQEETTADAAADQMDAPAMAVKPVKTYHSELIYGNAAEIVLCKSDLRQDVEEMQEVQNEILVAMLEG